MATETTLTLTQTPADWLLDKKEQLVEAQIELDRLHNEETDPEVKQKRRQVLFECEGTLNRVKRMLLEDAAGGITLNPPDPTLVARTEQLAEQLGQQLLTERKFSAKLKLFSDITKMLTRMIGAPN